MTSGKPGTRKPCGVEGCTRGPAVSRGLCNSHSRRRDRGDDPKEMRIYRPGEWGSWHKTNGYLKRYRIVKGVKEYQHQHREVMKEILGRNLLPHENVHHINGVRDDNRPENLELWSTSQPHGQRVVDKIAWAKEFLAEQGEL